MKKFITSGIALIVFLAVTQNVWAHCEVPCGIYDDKARVAEVHEHITTVEKAMKKIKELSAEGDKNYNQIVRWIMTKEEHAKKIQDIVYQYFMTQRIKPADPSDEAAYKKYISEITLLHKILRHAMKAKQTLDTSHPQAVHDDLEKFSQSYFGE